MKSLVAFSLLVAAVLAEPQYYYPGVVPSSGFYGGLYPGVSGFPVAGSYLSSPVVTKGVVSPYVVSPYTVPASYVVGKTVQDTPVQPAKVEYKQYDQAAVVKTVPFVHSINKREVKTPASTSPLVYSAAAPVATHYYNAAPYVTPYTAGVVPYTTGVAPYTAGVAPYTAGVVPYTAGVTNYNYAPYNYGVNPVARYF